MGHRIRLLLIITVTCGLCLVGCFNPRNTPLFRKLAEQGRERSAKYTEEALLKSPDLKELDHLCTNVIPTFQGLTLRQKRASSPKRTYLTYDFDADANYQRVKPFYLSYFTQNEWRVAAEYDGGWGPKSVEFRRDNYRIILYHGAMGDVEYALHCEKLSDSGEPLPNKGMNATREQ